MTKDTNENHKYSQFAESFLNTIELLETYKKERFTQDGKLLATFPVEKSLFLQLRNLKALAEEEYDQIPNKDRNENLICDRIMEVYILLAKQIDNSANDTMVLEGLQDDQLTVINIAKILVSKSIDIHRMLLMKASHSEYTKLMLKVFFTKIFARPKFDVQKKQFVFEEYDRSDLQKKELIDNLIAASARYQEDAIIPILKEEAAKFDPKIDIIHLFERRFYEEIKRNKLEEIEFLAKHFILMNFRLSQNYICNGNDLNKRSILSIAAMENKPQILEFVIRNLQDTVMNFDKYFSYTQISALSGAFENLKFLLNVDNLKSLIKDQIDDDKIANFYLVNVPDFIATNNGLQGFFQKPKIELNDTILSCAMKYKALDIVKYLLDFEYDGKKIFNLKHNNFKNILNIAVHNDLDEITDLLIERGAKLDENLTALGDAILKNKPEIVKKIIEIDRKAVANNIENIIQYAIRHDVDSKMLSLIQAKKEILVAEFPQNIAQAPKGPSEHGQVYLEALTSTELEDVEFDIINMLPENVHHISIPKETTRHLAQQDMVLQPDKEVEDSAETSIDEPAEAPSRNGIMNKAIMIVIVVAILIILAVFISQYV